MNLHMYVCIRRTIHQTMVQPLCIYTQQLTYICTYERYIKLWFSFSRLAFIHYGNISMYVCMYIWWGCGSTNRTRKLNSCTVLHCLVLSFSISPTNVTVMRASMMAYTHTFVSSRCTSLRMSPFFPLATVGHAPLVGSSSVVGVARDPSLDCCLM